MNQLWLELFFELELEAEGSSSFPFNKLKIVTYKKTMTKEDNQRSNVFGQIR